MGIGNRCQSKPWTCYGGRGNSTGRPTIPTNGLSSRQRTGTYFPHPTERGPLSIAALEGRCKKCGLACTPHGFRSSFRDWAEELSGASHNAIELSLAHAVGTQVERAYLRSDLIEQRRPLLQAWADYAAPGVESPF